MIAARHTSAQRSRAAAALYMTLASLSTSLASAQQVELAQRIIVRYKQTLAQSAAAATNTTRAADAAARFGISVNKITSTATGAEVLRLDRELTRGELSQLMETLRSDPEVDYVEEDIRMQAVFTPNDPQYNQQRHYFDAIAGIGLPATWDLTKGQGIRVAVADTGYRPHADLAANLLGGYDFISDLDVAVDGNGRDADATDPGDHSCPGKPELSSWHGTHVAGTVAAVSNNAVGVAGVAHGAKVVPVRVLGRCGGYDSDIAAGVIWAAGGTVPGVPANPFPAHVINLSLGGGGACSVTMQNAINAARTMRAVVVVAAGNDNDNAANFSPANCSGVITVAATNLAGGKANFSNFGPNVDLAAPGTSVLSTLNMGASFPAADNYEYYQGTSMATPHVAGSAALLLSVRPTMTPNQVEAALRNTARAFPAACAQCGTGIVNPSVAVTNSLPITDLLNPFQPELFLHGGLGLEYRYLINVPVGATNLRFILGGSGDADLYVRLGSPPTLSQFDCRPYSATSDESCTFAAPTPGPYYVMVRGYSEFRGGSLLATFGQ